MAVSWRLTLILGLITAFAVLLALGIHTGNVGATHDDGGRPHECDKSRTNYYVAAPDINSSGKATHTLKDIFGNSYDSGSYVIGWFVKDSPGGYTWRSGKSMWVDEGQTVKACIAQKAHLWWANKGEGGTVTWIVVSPEKFR